MRTHDGRIHVLQLVVGEAELHRQIAAQIVEHRVAGGDQQHFAAFGLLQVQRQAALVAVEGFEKVAIAFAEEMRANGAPHISTFAEVFDLDDFDAEVREMLRRERTGSVLFDGDDAHAGKR